MVFSPTPSTATRILLVTPWLYQDEDRHEIDMHWEWRNGPYNLILLGTILKNDGHCVKLADLQRDLVHCHGDLDACLKSFKALIQEFRPDIVGVSFFSVHFLEVQRAVSVAREACREAKLSPIFVAGGIHASVEPRRTLEELEFDYCCVGEGEQVLRRLANGENPASIAGLFSKGQDEAAPGDITEDLDSLPFPDWSLCDHRFYSHPTYARLKIKETSTLDILMGRGCVYRCNFCAYGCLSKVRFYSAEYLVDQMEALHRDYGVTSCYFVDSTIGNNRRRLVELCELLISRGTPNRITWLANIRVDQVKRELLTMMQAAGCSFLFYGFESGSQTMLDRMNKKTTVEQNYEAARLHNELRFPYNASMIVNYPGEAEEDIHKTIEFLRAVRPPSIGINWYVPLPGSADYDRLKDEGTVSVDDPLEWRRLGQVNEDRIYSCITAGRCRDLLAEVAQIAYSEIPRSLGEQWGASGVEVDENMMCAAEDISGAFSLDEFEAFHALSVEGKGPVTVVTPTEQWSYAVGFPLRKSELDEPALSTKPVLIQIEVMVERGKIGIGVLGLDEKDFLTEVTRGVGDSPTVNLVFGPLAACRYLMVRNVAADGNSSKAVLRSIRVCATESVRSQKSSDVGCCTADDGGRSTAEVVKVSTLAPQVAVQDLHERLGVDEPIEYSQASLSKPLAQWRMEDDDAPIFRYIYRHVKPRRHLEFGTWQGTGAVYCLEECDATVWTINLLEGEHNPDGSKAYSDRFPEAERVPTWSNKQEFTDEQGLPIVWYQTDALGFIGRFIRDGGFTHRVCQIYCDSRDWDASNYPADFFDTVLIDGGHAEDCVISDTRKGLRVLRSGGIIMWHDYCPDAAARESCATVQGVVGAMERIWDSVAREMSDLFWISPSWILLGIKR